MEKLQKELSLDGGLVDTKINFYFYFYFLIGNNNNK